MPLYLHPAPKVTLSPASGVAMIGGDENNCPKLALEIAPAVVILGDKQGVAGPRGRSAYESYLATTPHVPPLTEQEWAAATTESLDLAQHFGYLERPDAVIDGGLI